ncbi:MAG TPA: hypothetical protein VFZ56_03450 [Gemmatimonadaceae bacterium]
MKKLALYVLFVSIAAIFGVYLQVLTVGHATPWAPWVLALSTALSMLATMILGAARRGRRNGGLGGLAFPLLVTFVLIAGGFALALALPGAGEPLVLGLPRRAAIVLYGIGLLPLLVLPVAYAVTFDEMTLSEEDLDRVRRAAAAARKSPIDQGRAGD